MCEDAASSVFNSTRLKVAESAALNCGKSTLMRIQLTCDSCINNNRLSGTFNVIDLILCFELLFFFYFFHTALSSQTYSYETPQS